MLSRPINHGDLLKQSTLNVNLPLGGNPSGMPPVTAPGPQAAAPRARTAAPSPGQRMVIPQNNQPTYTTITR